MLSMGFTAAITAPVQPDRLGMCAFVSAFVTLVCFFLMRSTRSRAWGWAFAVSAAFTAVCGAAQSAWPLAMVTLVWLITTLRGADVIVMIPRLRLRRTAPRRGIATPSRLAALFDPTRCNN